MMTPDHITLHPLPFENVGGSGIFTVRSVPAVGAELMEPYPDQRSVLPFQEGLPKLPARSPSWPPLLAGGGLRRRWTRKGPSGSAVLTSCMIGERRGVAGGSPYCLARFPLLLPHWGTRLG